jgi:hypothetical protein
MHARTRSGAAQGTDPRTITAERLKEGLSACAKADFEHAEQNRGRVVGYFKGVDNVVELAQKRLTGVLMLDLVPHFELADLLRANWEGPIEKHELVELTFACEVRPLLSIRAAQGASSWRSTPPSVRR